MVDRPLHIMADLAIVEANFTEFETPLWNVIIKSKYPTNQVWRPDLLAFFLDSDLLLRFSLSYNSRQQSQKASGLKHKKQCLKDCLNDCLKEWILKYNKNSPLLTIIDKSKQS